MLIAAVFTAAKQTTQIRTRPSIHMTYLILHPPPPIIPILFNALSKSVRIHTIPLWNCLIHETTVAKLELYSEILVLLVLHS